MYTTNETHRDGRRGYTVMGEQGARTLASALKLRPGDRLVDVGAGTCVTAGQLLILNIFLLSTSGKADINIGP